MQIPRAAHLFLKIAAGAIVFPLLTGFASAAPESIASIATETAMPAARQEAPTPRREPITIYNWRRVGATGPSPGAVAVASPADVVKDPPPAGDTVLSWETGRGKSRLIPAGEILGFLTLLNLYDRTVFDDDRTNGKRTYASDFGTTWEHLSKQNWEFDKDPFNVNQFGHPYQGATMYGFARSAGLGFWESWAYSNVGSFLWKMAGETDPPSINDMATTGNSGSLLGEALFRMSALVLNEQPRPDGWHELAAAAISPPTGFNRLVFGDRFKPVFPTNSPATFWRFRLGAMMDSRKDATVDFAMSYGLPGKPGYTYKRPLDYFDFQISGIARASNPVGNVLLRGLLYGKPYDFGEDYRGIWGLYGSYDYISPNIFRVSTTALSLGTTAQWWMAPEIALQGSVLGGVGFGGAGVTPASDGQRDYHYGVTPQGLLALRMIFANRLALETVTRGYYVSGTGSDNAEGDEAIVRVNSNVMVRLFRRHGISLQIIEAIRDAKYGNLPGRHQSNLTFGIFYTFLGDSHLGTVEWRQ